MTVVTVVTAVTAVTAVTVAPAVIAVIEAIAASVVMRVSLKVMAPCSKRPSVTTNLKVEPCWCLHAKACGA